MSGVVGVCRAPESHDPTGLGLSRSPNDMSGPVEGTSRRSARAASLPLQFREASSRIEIWTGSQDASPTGWPDPQAADFERSLLIETAFWVVEQCPIHAVLLGSIPIMVISDSPASQSSVVAWCLKLWKRSPFSLALVVRCRHAVRQPFMGFVGSITHSQAGKTK
jgi:hypothetical protein